MFAIMVGLPACRKSQIFPDMVEDLSCFMNLLCLFLIQKYIYINFTFYIYTNVGIIVKDLQNCKCLCIKCENKTYIQSRVLHPNNQIKYFIYETKLFVCVFLCLFMNFFLMFSYVFYAI